MRIAVHHQTLLDIFNGHGDYATMNAVLSSKISITPEILTRYQNSLINDPKYLAWFASSWSGRRFSLNLPQSAPSAIQASDGVTDGYGSASYFGGATLFAETTNLAGTALTALAQLGVQLMSARTKISSDIHGDNPFLTIALTTRGTVDFNIFDRFVIPEDSIVVYDKYINGKSIELLEHIAGRMQNNASLYVFHTFNPRGNLLDTSTIATRLQRANNNISVTVKTCDPSFTRQAHDRYIFLGSRIQIVFTAGLDCFGERDPSNGKRVNRQSKINFYDVTEGDHLDIAAADGTVHAVRHFTNA